MIYLIYAITGMTLIAAIICLARGGASQSAALFGGFAYFPFSGYIVPIVTSVVPLSALFAIISLWLIRGRMLDQYKRSAALMARAPIVCLWLLLTWGVAITVVHSVDVLPGLEWCVQCLVFLALLYVVKSVAANGTSVRSAFDALSIGLTTTAAAVIIFRLAAAQENGYLHSVLNGFVNTSYRASTLFSSNPDNVLDPDKSGGLYLNANTASALLGMSMFLFWAAALYYRRSRFAFTSLLCGLAVAFTGSKTGAVLLVGLVALAVICLLVNGLRIKLVYAILGLSLALVVLFGSSILFAISPTFSTRVEAARTGRDVLNEAASSLFASHPFLGLGFGGWADSIPEYTAVISIARLPPHNLEVRVWSELGIPGAALVVILLIIVAKKQLSVSGDQMISRRARRASLLAFMGTLWLVLHFQGDVGQLWGDFRIMPVLALLIIFPWLAAKCIDGKPGTPRQHIRRRHGKSRTRLVAARVHQ